MQEIKDAPNDFRNYLATVEESGKRKWIYARQPQGPLYNIRTILSVFYLIVFFLVPFLKINNKPLFLFNVLERKFILFGVTFWPQDFFIFGVGLLTFFVFIVFFTVVYGRVFCGWTCPQTIFMEMVFRRIEYWIEGNKHQQRALNNAPLTSKFLFKKILKHGIFIAISIIITNTFLAYIIGTDEVFKIIFEPIALHTYGFTSFLVFTFLFYGVFAFMREQVCIAICPYGRLQGVLLDQTSAAVVYDYVRGETRKKFKKNEIRTAGDCIDCRQCVEVCPTGIDIRNGVQLECVNCTACIDACNFMMEKVGLPKGLIRIASEDTIAHRKKFKFTKRAKAYSLVLVLLIGVMSTLLLTRKDIQSHITRAAGLLYQKRSDNTVSNLYNIKMLNKTTRDTPITLKLENTLGEIELVGKDLNIKAETVSMGSFFIILPESEIRQRSTKLKVGVYSGTKKIRTLTTTFLGPINN